MKLTHVLLVLAVAGIAVAAWRMTRDDSSQPAAANSGMQSEAAAAQPAPADLGSALPSGQAATGPAPARSVAPTTAEAPQPFSTNTQRTPDSAVVPASDLGGVSITAGGQDFSDKYSGVDEAGRRSAYESLERRILMSKGRSEKEGGFSDEDFERANRELMWLQDNLQP